MNHSLNSVVWRSTNADILENVHIPVMFVISHSRSRILCICINAYTGESPPTCDGCSKSLRVLHHLETHQCIHTVVRLYTWDVSNKSYRVQRLLKKHLRMHSYECSYMFDVCKKLFAEQGNLWCTNAYLENVLIHVMFVINHSRWRVIWMYINTYILENVYIRVILK